MNKKLRALLLLVIVATMLFTFVACQTSFTVTFETNGGTAIEKLAVDKGAASWLGDKKTTKQGYTFDKWYTDAKLTQEFKLTSVVSGDITLYAGWKVNAFTVTLNHDGGTGVASVAADYNTAIAQPTSTKVGYTFDGWYNGDTKFDFATKIVNNITLTAHWTVNKYTVTFDYQGKGTGVETKEVTFGQAYGELPLPTHADFNFVGWYTAIDSGAKIEVTTIVAEASDITLYAKWTQKAQSTIRFVTNGGTEVASIVKTYGEATWLNEITTTKTGYTFAGWYSDVLLTQEVTTTSIIEKASIDLYAKWTINSYTVTLNHDGGTGVATVVTDYNTTIAQPTSTKVGYTFDGWYNGATKFDFATKIVGNITLTAHWTINSFTVTLNHDGGSGAATVAADYNTTIAQPASIKIGYTFDGWYNGDTKFDFATKIVSNITLTAHWTVNKYTVTFDYQGKGTGVATKEVTFDQAYGELPIPTAVSGYTFGGWFTLTTGGDEVTAATVVKTANAATLYARWNEVLSLAAPTNINKWDDALTWDPVAHAASYEVAINKQGLAPVNTTSVGTIFKLPNAVENGEYTVEIKAVRGNIKSAATRSVVSGELELTADKTNTYLTGKDQNGVEGLRVWFVGNSYSTSNYTLTVLEGDAISVNAEGTAFEANKAGFAKIKYVKNTDKTEILRLVKVVDKLAAFAPSAAMQARNQVVSTLATSDYVNKNAQPLLVGAANTFKILPTTDKPIDSMSLKIDVCEKGTTNRGFAQAREEGIAFDMATSQGKTFVVTVKQRYSTTQYNKEVYTFEVVVNDGFNVYTTEELRQRFADKTIPTINLQANIEVELKDVRYNMVDGKPHVINDVSIFNRDNGIDGVDVTVNGNYYNVDTAKVPTYNKKAGNTPCDCGCGTNNSDGFPVALSHGGVFEVDSARPAKAADGTATHEERHASTARATFNNFKLIGNKCEGGLVLPETKPDSPTFLDVFVNAGYKGIITFGSAVILDNVVAARLTDGVFAAYQGSNVKTIDCNMYDVFDCAINNYSAGTVEVINSKFARSECSLIKVVDNTESGVPRENVPQIYVDKLSTIDNWTTGEQVYFQAYGLAAVVPTLKSNVQAGVKNYGYSMVKGVEQAGTTAVVEHFNLQFMIQAGNPSTSATSDFPEGKIVVKADYNKQTGAWTGGTAIHRATNYASAMPDPRISQGALVFPVGRYSDLSAFGALVGAAPSATYPTGTGITSKVIVALQTFLQAPGALTPEQQQIIGAFKAVNGLANITPADAQDSAKITRAVGYLSAKTAFDDGAANSRLLEICTNPFGSTKVQISLFISYLPLSEANIK